MEYLVLNKGEDAEEVLEQNKFVSNRIGKITDVLTEKKPSKVIPFKGKFPLVKEIDYSSFLNDTMKFHLFEDCTDEIKTITRKAEKIKFLDKSFKDYLNKEDISTSEFGKKNPKIKQDILYSWLFKNKMDIGILDI